MDIYLNRTLELGQKIPYGAAHARVDLGHTRFFVGNPSRAGGSYPVTLKAAVYCGDTEVLNLVAEVQASTKAQELGYALRFESGIGEMEPDRVLAFTRDDPQAVGELLFSASGAYLEDQDVQVDPAHQRRGIATAMYQQAEALTGKAFLSRLGEPLPYDAAALWANPDRPFGVDALYCQPRRLLWVNPSDLLPAALKSLPSLAFDARQFSQSDMGQLCMTLANQGAGHRVGLQDARVRGLVARGHEQVDGFVSDPRAPLKLMRRVLCERTPPALALCNNKGLPDSTISARLDELTQASHDAALGFLLSHIDALAALDTLDALDTQIRTLARTTSAARPTGDVAEMQQALAVRHRLAMSTLTALIEQQADYRASQF